MIAALLLSVALTGATDCQTVTIEHDGINPVITTRTGDSPKVSVVGHFLNVGEWDGVLQSVDIADSDIIGATVCADGSIELAYAAAAPASKPTPEVNASQDAQAPIYLVPRVQDVTAGSAV